MRAQSIAICCFVPLVLAACQDSPDATSTAIAITPISSQEQGIVPKPTVKPVETSSPDLPTPTLVPELEFTDEGPYLGFVETNADVSSLLLIDAYHLGHRRIDVPLDESPYDFARNRLSPDSRYFVYYEGSLQSGDLTLAMFDLENERIDIRIPVVSSDYKAKLEELAADLFANPPEELMDYPLSSIKEGLEFSFQYGISAHAWSSDGKHLAFAGQIDGPSSDLYVYDTDTTNIRRLTSGRSNIHDISWSPDGRWILHGSAYWVGQGTFLTNHLASADGATVVSFPALEGQVRHGWVGSSHFILSEGDNGPGSYDLKAIDVDSMQTISLWPSTYTNFAFDPVRSLLLFNHFPFFENDPDPGLYLIGVGSAEARMINEETYWELEFVGLNEYPFIGVNDDIGTVLISEKGEFKQIDDEIHQILISPDKGYIALYDLRGSNGLAVYDVSEDKLHTISTDWIDEVTWRDDSKGLFFFSQDALYLYDLGARELILILEDISWDSFFGPIKWVQP